LPALTGEYVYESLVPVWLMTTHVAHVTGESVGISLSLPDVYLLQVIE
jgi:hypothetical protein